MLTITVSIIPFLFILTIVSLFIITLFVLIISFHLSPNPALANRATWGFWWHANTET